MVYVGVRGVLDGYDMAWHGMAWDSMGLAALVSGSMSLADKRKGKMTGSISLPKNPIGR